MNLRDGTAVKWRCRCDCGELVLIRSSRLSSGGATQCRKCLNTAMISKTSSLLIDKVEEYIGTQVYREFQLENRFYGAYVPKYNLLIESDGSYWHNMPEAVSINRKKMELLKEMDMP